MDFSYDFVADPDETLRGNLSLHRMRKWRWANWTVWPLFALLVLMYRAQGVPWSRLTYLWFAIVFVAALQILGPILQRWMVRREFVLHLRRSTPCAFSPSGATD